MIKFGEAGAGGMRVRIDQPGQYNLAFQVDDFRLRASGSENAFIRTDPEYATVLNCECLMNRELFIDGDDLAMMKNQVGTRRVDVPQNSADQEPRDSADQNVT